MRRDQYLFWPFLAPFLASLFWPTAAQATATWVRDTGWVLQPNGSGVYEVLPRDGRGGQHTTTCTSASCQRTGSVAGPVGNPKPTLSPYATFDKAAVARGAINLGSRALPWLSVGYGLYDWYTSAGLSQDGDTVSGSDPYTPSVLGSGIYTWGEAPNKTLGYGTRDAACVAYNAWRPTVGLIPLSGIYARLSSGGWVCTGTFPDGVVSWTATSLVQLPSNRCPFGSADSSGQCPYTGESRPLSAEDAISRLVSAPITADQLRAALQEILDAGGSLQSTGTGVTGPATAPGSVSTRTTTAPSGAPITVTTTTIYNYTYNGNQVTITEKTTTANPDGSAIEEVTAPELLCGVPGAPPCNVKVDESGTPAATSPDLSVFESLKAQDAQKVSEALSSVPQPSFGFIGAPPIVACRPVPLPNEMGEIDACNVVDTVRELMGFLWALAAAWISLGWIREAVNGG